MVAVCGSTTIGCGDREHDSPQRRCEPDLTQAAMNRQLARRARRDVASVAARLRRAGWKVREEVSAGAPLAVLLETVNRTDGNLLIVGARAACGLRRALLGSVAAGTVDRSRVPVLVVR